MGAVQFVTKPFTGDALVAALTPHRIRPKRPDPTFEQAGGW